MNNPEVQQIMGDPAMRMILEQMQTDPQVKKNSTQVLMSQTLLIVKQLIIAILATIGSREDSLENSSNCISGPTSDLTADKVSTFVAQLKIRGIY